MSNAEKAIETLARVSTEISRDTITMFHTGLLEIAAAIEAGDLAKAREVLAVSVANIAGIYGILYLEVPHWCPKLIRQRVADGVAAIRENLRQLNSVRQHEKREQLELEAGDPPKLAN